jgi:hypothetical protein
VAMRPEWTSRRGVTMLNVLIAVLKGQELSSLVVLRLPITESDDQLICEVRGPTVSVWSQN